MDSKDFNCSVFVLVSCLILSLSVSSLAKRQPSCPLEAGYYRYTCPSAEAIVRNVVYKAITRNPGIAAGLIRLHFHDCFVRGCDASVLLDGLNSEKESIANKNSLRGFEVIDEAKKQLEAACPGTVSCADILAFAARDSSYNVGKINYDVQAGRRDGHVSIKEEALANLPSPFVGVKELIKSFARKGMSVDEMVTLSGAHSIGIAHCAVFANRLYPQNKQQNLPIDRQYERMLKSICPPESLTNGTGVANPTNFDVITPNQLDNKYYMDLKSKKGLLVTDQTLMSDPKTAKMVNFNARYGRVWGKKFADAMVHMGTLDVLTGQKGEIRKNCHFVN
ncbi:hypothetical protein R3W88_015617 [Solanum pinnatisectum]|uniref:Peroxidase n=1 Tax=Solanum pinnatisectum TaxID=50273 RepID=A0AAV9KV56_9SOLN|nr:hypothetical protein R3W88_015617 [Solanum pinnatisectum]